MRGMMPRISLGSVLAFLAPGSIILIVLSLFFAPAGELIDSVTSGRGGFGPVVAAILAALTLGVILNGIRSVVVDWAWYNPRIWTQPLTEPANAFEVMIAKDQVDIYEALLENTFRFYMFYANTALALFILVLVMPLVSAERRLSLLAVLGIVFMAALLFAAARDSLADYSAATRVMVSRKPEEFMKARSANRDDGLRD